MKDLLPICESQLTQSRKNKWKRLFKSRITRKLSQQTQADPFDTMVEFESDRLPQSTNDIQNNVNYYFDFSFIE